MSESVTLLMTTYNQQRFAAEAMRSLLAQDWSGPLQVVVADDASTDGTFAELRAVVDAYRGAFEVDLFRQKENVGPMLNTARALERCTGDIIVRAHGDDIQLPGRVTSVVAAFQQSGATMVTTNAIVVDTDGAGEESVVEGTESGPLSLADIARVGWSWHLLGASFSWRRKLEKVFGWLDPSLIGSGGDHVLPFRAALLGGVYFLGDPLLKWRRHPTQQTRLLTGGLPEGSLRSHNAHLHHNLEATAQCWRDLLVLKQRLGPKSETLAPLEKILVERITTGLLEFGRTSAELRREGLRPSWEARTPPRADGDAQ